MMACTDEQQTIQATKNWLEYFVIKHNFCPFAVKPFRENRIRYVSYPVKTEVALVEKLSAEILLLKDANPQDIETSIVIVPYILSDFLDYNQFLDVADSLLAELGVEGIIQIASFHPDYQFADLDREDVRNYTNRSPYPLFHLIREDSIEKAREAMNTEAIPHRNMEVLLALGVENVSKEWR